MVNANIPPVIARWAPCLAVLAWATVSFIVERLGNGDWAAWNYVIAFIILGLYLVILLRDHLAATLTSFYQIYYYLGMLASAAVISSGAHMIEIDRLGNANGLFWVLVIWFVAGMEATRIGYDFSGRVHFGQGIARLVPIINRVIILAVVGGVLAMAAYVFLVTGGPLLQDVDRVTFWRTMAPPGTSLLPSLVNQTFFFAAFYFLWQRRLKGGLLVPAFVIAGYILTALLVLGQKFSIFIVFLHSTLLIVPGFIPSIRISARNITWAAVIFFAIICYVAINYSIDGRGYLFIAKRVALQAQLLWSTFDVQNPINLFPEQPNCYLRCNNFVSGIDYISNKFLPKGLYDFYSRGGTTLSGFMPALSFLTLGTLISGLLHLSISFALGIVQKKLMDSCDSGNVIYSFLLFKTQFSLVLIWFAALNTAIPGLVVTLALLLIFRVLLSKEIVAFANDLWSKNGN